MGLTWATCSLEDVGVIICQGARVCVTHWVCSCVELTCPGALVPNWIKGILAAQRCLLFTLVWSPPAPQTTVESHWFTWMDGTLIPQHFLDIYPQHKQCLPTARQRHPKLNPGASVSHSCTCDVPALKPNSLLSMQKHIFSMFDKISIPVYFVFHFTLSIKCWNILRKFNE